jgi:hypothetical protein
MAEIKRFAAVLSMCVVALELTVTGESYAATQERFCGHVHVNGAKGELHAIGTSCTVARQVAARRIKHRRLPAGWKCAGGGTNGAVYATCRRGSKLVTVYQPPSVYGE